MNRPPNWEDLERRRQPEADPRADAFAELCATIFTGGGGADLLKMMRSMTIERRTPPNAPESFLREMEAERRFVASLERARDRGLEIIAAKKKPPA